jgi:hypothetical protein
LHSTALSKWGIDGAGTGRNGDGIHRHKVAQAGEEKTLFEAFLRLASDFAGEEIIATNPTEADPPDYVCVTGTGRRIGVEIGQLAQRYEFRAGILRGRITSDLLEAIGHPQPVNHSKKFWLLVFCPKAKVHIGPVEFAEFRHSLMRLIEHIESEWPAKFSRIHYPFRDLTRFPPLNHYLEHVSFVPGRAKTSGGDWIVPIGATDSFEDGWAAQTMLELLQEKRKRCRALKTECDDIIW